MSFEFTEKEIDKEKDINDANDVSHWKCEKEKENAYPTHKETYDSK